jgi:hypothetical protein
MAASVREVTCRSAPGGFRPQAAQPGTWWSQRREASLNWLALGVLLAAWNAADSGTAQLRRRPAALRGYSSVSVRAVQRAPSVKRATTVERTAPIET